MPYEIIYSWILFAFKKREENALSQLTSGSFIDCSEISGYSIHFSKQNPIPNFQNVFKNLSQYIKKHFFHQWWWEYLFKKCIFDFKYIYFNLTIKLFIVEIVKKLLKSAIWHPHNSFTSLTKSRFIFNISLQSKRFHFVMYCEKCVEIKTLTIVETQKYLT